MLRQVLIEAFRSLRKPARDSAGPPPTPPGVKEVLDRGDAALASGRHDDARRLYREALAADPPNLYAHYRLAESWLATNGYAEAREWCERGLAIDPHQIGLLELLAETASRMGDPLLSVQCYEAIATRNPEVENLDKYI